MASHLFALLALLACSGAAAARRESHVAVDKFCIEATGQLTSLRWDAITSLSQAVAPISVDATGAVAPADAALWAQWSAPLVAAAHGNGSTVVLPLHIVSKPVAAALFASPVNDTLLAAAAAAAAALANSNGYDGVQLDIEGLQVASAAGYEAFVGAMKRALDALSARAGRLTALTLSVTVYAPKLVLSDFATYDVRRLTDGTLCDFVFLMGYDMGWLEVPPGGAQEAKPNAPLDGLIRGLANAVAAGAAPARMVLGLPLYGKLYTCDGTAPARMGNCSCAEKNMQNKKVDLLQAAAAVPGSGCTSGVDAATASLVLDCPGGAPIPGFPQPPGQRQQAWFENHATIAAKMALAANGYKGVGFWTADGVQSGGSAEGKATWDAVAEFVAGG